VPACLRVLAETKKISRFQTWALYDQVINSLDEAVRMGGPTAFWYDLKSWEQQGMRSRTHLTNGVMSLAEVFYLRSLAEQRTLLMIPKPAFLQKVMQSFDLLLTTYQPEQGALEAFLQAKFRNIMGEQIR
jgi:hypothetical protein